jgi:hypothetical protein
MSTNAIYLRSYSPDLVVEFDLPPGTHARIGASPKAEVTLPLTGIPPFSYTIGRFQNGRLFLAEPDGLILRRVDLPDTLSLPPYRFIVADSPGPGELASQPGGPGEGKKHGPLKILPLAFGAVIVMASVALFAVSQCGKSATKPRSELPVPTRTVPAAPPGKPTVDPVSRPAR